MKMMIKYIVVLCTLCFAACTDMNSLHEKYLEKGEYIYTGVIDSLKSFPGYERVKFSWEINADPRITQTVIYWRNKTDSVVIEVNRTASGNLPLETLLEFPEGSYIFEFVTKDDYGNKSLTVQKTVEVYGEKYIQLLKTRGIKSLIAKPENSVLITLSDIEDTNILHTLLQYTDYTNMAYPIAKEVKVENNSKQITLTGIKSGEKVIAVSVFLPSADALDEVKASPKEYQLP